MLRREKHPGGPRKVLLKYNWGTPQGGGNAAGKARPISNCYFVPGNFLLFVVFPQIWRFLGNINGGPGSLVPSLCRFSSVIVCCRWRSSSWLRPVSEWDKNNEDKNVGSWLVHGCPWRVAYHPPSSESKGKCANGSEHNRSWVTRKWRSLEEEKVARGMDPAWLLFWCLLISFPQWLRPYLCFPILPSLLWLLSPLQTL